MALDCCHVSLTSLADDVLLSCLSFAAGEDLCRVSQTCTRLLQQLNSQAAFVWRRALQQEFATLGLMGNTGTADHNVSMGQCDEGGNDDANGGDSATLVPALRAYRVARALAQLNGPLRWRPLRPSRFDPGVSGIRGRTASLSKFVAQEGHAADTLGRDGGRWIALVNGFTNEGVRNDVTIVDGASLTAAAAAVTDTENHSFVKAEPCRVQEAVHGSPRRHVYGHTVLAIGVSTLCVFGGCVYGSYRGDVSDLYFLDINIDAEQFSGRIPRDELRPTATAVAATPAMEGQTTSITMADSEQEEDEEEDGAAGGDAPSMPLTRAYCSVSLVALPSRQFGTTCRSIAHLLFFGGLHAGAPTNVIELLQLEYDTGGQETGSRARVDEASAESGPCTAAETVPVAWDRRAEAAVWDACRGGENRCHKLRWSRPAADGLVAGEAPAPRFGHSCTPVGAHEAPPTCLVIAGGSDGNDLLRNGSELLDVAVLHIRSSGSSGAPGRIWPDDGPLSGCMLRWSRLRMMPQPEPPRRDVWWHSALGRCHSARRVGHNIVFFGGGATLSNTVAALDVSPLMAVDGDKATSCSVDTAVSASTGAACESHDFAPFCCEWRGNGSGSAFALRAPRPRLSQVMCVAHGGAGCGQCLWMYGGWGGGGLRDMYMLDLFNGARLREHEASLTNPVFGDVDSSDDDENDNADDDHEAGGGYFPIGGGSVGGGGLMEEIMRFMLFQHMQQRDAEDQEDEDEDEDDG